MEAAPGLGTGAARRPPRTFPPGGPGLQALTLPLSWKPGGSLLLPPTAHDPCMHGRGASAHRARSALLLRSQETAPQPPYLHPKVHGPLHQTSPHCDLGAPQLPGPRRLLPLSPPPARASQLPPLRPLPRGQARPAGSSRPRPPALVPPTCPSWPRPTPDPTRLPLLHAPSSSVLPAHPVSPRPIHAQVGSPPPCTYN